MNSSVKIHPLAGTAAPREVRVDVDILQAAYYGRRPDIADRSQRVHFGTNGHRGTSLRGAFNEPHVLAIAQAICDYRAHEGITGPVYLGKDTHALSEPGFVTVLEVLAGNHVEVMVDEHDGCTPTPAISRAIVNHNRNRSDALADGIVITPSHNPPRDGGIKYNSSTGGPAEEVASGWIESRANRILAGGTTRVPRVPFERARRKGTTHPYDYIGTYVRDLAAVVDMEAIARSGLRIGVDPMGGAAVTLWQPIAERYGVHLEIVNNSVDPTFSFVPLDWDGQIRMDCSSPYAMASLIRMKDRFDLACATDPDADRHGIVTNAGLMNPNHYLAAAIAYLFTHRPSWEPHVAIGKTVVTSAIIDRVAEKLGRTLVEVPVGFKWFVPGLLDGSLGFGGEESAGASFLAQDGTTWTTDKDGVVMSLLAAELIARIGRDPSKLYAELAEELGDPVYARIDAPLSPDERTALAALSPDDVTLSELGDDPIEAVLTAAPGNGAPIGGLKVVTAHGWIAARPSGTEAVYKLYAESFRGPEHLRLLQDEAQALVGSALAATTR